MEQNEIKIEIVSAVRNRREITLQCLRSLDRINRPNLRIHKVVVDDGSTDGTSEAVNKYFPDVEIIQGDGNLWCSGAANLGIKKALQYDPDYILLINDDTIFDSNFLQALVDTAKKNERTIVGGLLLLWDEPHRVFQVAPRWDTFYGGWRHYCEQTIWTMPNKPFEVQIIVGNCTLFPGKVFREEGFFADYWLPHYGDAEFTPRLRKRGWKLLIEPRARVFNQPNTPPAKMSEMSVSQLYSALWRNYNDAHNLRNRFVCYWLGAPTRIHGSVAFFVYLVRLGLQWLGIGRRWMTGWPEKPFNEECSTN